MLASFMAPPGKLASEVPQAPGEGAGNVQPAQTTQRAPGLHTRRGGSYIGPFVYGGLDGVVTTFAVVSGVAGAALSSGVLLVLGLANLFADGVSMAVGAYLSAKSEREYYEREHKTEAWEIAHFPEGEREELYQMHRADGYSDSDARTLVEIQTRRPETWATAMMVSEHGILPSETNPIARGLVTFLAFILAGAVPLIAYIAGLAVPGTGSFAFGTSIALSALTLFGLGAARVLVTERNALRSGLEMLGVGGLAAGVAYAVGFLLQGLV